MKRFTLDSLNPYEKKLSKKSYSGLQYKIDWYDTRNGKKGTATIKYPKSYIGKQVDKFDILRHKVAKKQYAKDSDIVLVDVKRFS